MLLKAEHQHTLPDFLFFLLPPLFRISEAEQFKAPSLLLPVHPHRRDQGSSPWPGGHLVYQPHSQPTHADWKLSSFSCSCLLLTPPIGSSPVKALPIPIFRKVSAVWDCPAPLWDCLWLLSPTIIFEKIYKEDGTEINRPPVALLTFKQHSVPEKAVYRGVERRGDQVLLLYLNDIPSSLWDKLERISIHMLVLKPLHNEKLLGERMRFYSKSGLLPFYHTEAFSPSYGLLKISNTAQIYMNIFTMTFSVNELKVWETKHFLFEIFFSSKMYFFVFCFTAAHMKVQVNFVFRKS